MTEQSLGATSVALGDTRPDNTSAIIALQRAAATPSEMTKQNLYKSVEDLYRIYLEFMGGFYGTRMVDMEPPEELRQVFDFVGQEMPNEISMPFCSLDNLPSYPVYGNEILNSFAISQFVLELSLIWE